MSKHQTIFDTIHAHKASLVVTDPQGTIVYANLGQELVTGYATAQMIGSRPGNLWGGNMSQNFYTEMWQGLKQARPFVGSVTNIRKSGRKICQQLHIAPVFSENGQIQYYFEVQPKKKGDSDFVNKFKQIFSAPTNVYLRSEWLLSQFGIKDNVTLDGFFTNTLVKNATLQLEDRYADRKLILAAQKHPKAFNDIYIKYHKDIETYFARHLNGNSISEDLAQETFMRAFVRLGDFRMQNASYKTYLLRVAHNLLVNYFRKKKDVPFSLIAADIYEPTPTRHVFPRVFSVFSYVKQLNTVQRHIIHLYYEEGYKIKEIAVQIGKSENAVKLQLSRARKKLRQIFKK